LLPAQAPAPLIGNRSREWKSPMTRAPGVERLPCPCRRGRCHRRRPRASELVGGENGRGSPEEREEGLARFDGVHFKVFDKHNIDAIKNNFILSLFEDREGTLWIGSWGGGLVRFRGGQFEAYTESDGLSNNIVNAITQDREGRIWIGTGEGGLNVWKDGKFTAYTTAQGLSHNRVHALYPSHDGTIWIGSDGGLDRFRDASPGRRQRRVRRRRSPLTTLATTPAADSDAAAGSPETQPNTKEGQLWESSKEK
jgi:hypothetical protein